MTLLWLDLCMSHHGITSGHTSYRKVQVQPNNLMFFFLHEPRHRRLRFRISGLQMTSFAPEWRVCAICAGICLGAYWDGLIVNVHETESDRLSSHEKTRVLLCIQSYLLDWGLGAYLILVT